MPMINVKLMENILTPAQKQELATRFTDDFAEIVGEPTRPLIWVIIEDVPSGQIVIGGDAVTPDGVRELLATAKVPAGAS